MVREEMKKSPQDCSKQANPVENGQNVETLFSPRFKSVAAMAGWDEEALLIASLVVEDTPDRDFKHKKRSDLRFKTPPSTNSRRKRRAQRRSPVSIDVPVLYLDEEETAIEESEKNMETKAAVSKKNKTEGNALTEQKSAVSCSNSALPCIDKLREELSCAICLEICFEPSTTSCGHSFCKKCLRSAADKCGKRCPKCRQLISNGRSCTVNTVLWNTIQLLFPQEVEARKAAGALSSSREVESQIPERAFYGNVGRSIRPPVVASSRETSLRRRGTLSQVEDATLPLRFQREDLSRLASREASTRRNRRRGTPSQDEDAALALRLQREEFMGAFRGNDEQSRRNSIYLARANLRAMASRAINTRSRNQAM